MTKIYKLCKGSTVVYIGKTKRTLKERFNEHMKKKKLEPYLYSIELIIEVLDEMAPFFEDINIRNYGTIVNGLNKISAKGKKSPETKEAIIKKNIEKCKKIIKGK